MHITFYTFNQGGKLFISTTQPSSLGSYPTFDIYLDLPAKYTLIDQIIKSTTAEMIYKIHIPISDELFASLPVVDNQYVAALYLINQPDGLYYSLDNVNTSIVLDPPHPLEYFIFANAISNLNGINAKIIFRIQS